MIRPKLGHYTLAGDEILAL